MCMVRNAALIMKSHRFLITFLVQALCHTAGSWKQTNRSQIQWFTYLGEYIIILETPTLNTSGGPLDNGGGGLQFFQKERNKIFVNH